MSYLLKPLDKCKLTLNNKLVMPPMATSKAEQDGKISKDILDYYDEKSQGGYIALIIIEHSFIKQQGKASERQLSIADDSVVEDLKKLANIIHKNGSKAVMQINHAGSSASKQVTGYEPVGPSSIVNPRKGDAPKELTKKEIKDIIQDFRDAALRVKEAGFDGVEIHSAHGYILNQFFSPLTNKRTDEYGGDLLGRIKIHLEIIKAVRDAVGDDFPILLRLGASDYMEGGITIEDSKIAAVEFDFEDGLFVRRADSAHASLVGARVVRLGNASADEAMARVATIIPHENKWWVRAWGPFWLTTAEMVHGLGLTADPNRLTLTVERHGTQETVTIAPAGAMAHGEGGAVDMSHWVSMRTAAAPLSEQQNGNLFWWTWLPDSRTLYVSLRGVVPAPNSATNRSQWNQVFALADSLQPARMVLDIRDNLGGNGGLNRYPVQQIVRRPWLDRPDRLFVIIGRRTFSAGQQFANLLEAWTQATFVGEPTGQRPSQYGDHRPLTLPNSHLTVMISTVFHQAPDEFDRREFIPPDAFAPLTSEAYRQGEDPAFAAALSWKAGPTVADSMGALVAAGDSAGAERWLRLAQQQPVNRYRSLEAEINALGYRLLGGGAAAQAVTVFRINTQVYPQSANAFDSLGEALLTTGQRDAGVAAYRQALQIEPGFPPSQQALQRLGVQ